MQPLTPAEEIVRAYTERPTAWRRPDLFIASVLELVPDARRATAADLNLVRAADTELAEAQAALAKLPNAGDDERTAQHAAARARLVAWLAALSEDAPDATLALAHLGDCTGEHGVETAEHAAETPYGRCAVRVARCASCGVSSVVNRRVILPVDFERVARQRAFEARESGQRARMAREWGSLLGAVRPLGQGARMSPPGVGGHRATRQGTPQSARTHTRALRTS